jgi:hypothetical protein
MSQQLDLLPATVVEKTPAPRTHIRIARPPAAVCTGCGGMLKGVLDVRVRPMPEFIVGACMGYLQCPNHGIAVRVPIDYVDCELLPAAVIEGPAQKLLVSA